MGCFKFLANNMVEGAVITASTENAQFPASNLKHDFRTKVYRSTSNSDSIVFDLGAIEDVTHIGLVDNWQDGFGVSTVTVEANGTDTWGSPAFSTTMTLDNTFGVSINELAATESYRYWRLVLTSSLSYCELTYVFIGKATDIETNSVSYGWGYRGTEIAKKSTTRYGQDFTDPITTRKELNGLGFEVMNTTEIDKIFEVFDGRMTSKPFMVKMGDDTNTIISNENRLNGLYKLTTIPAVTNPSAFGLYNVTLNVKEQK
jgi:hypothetical protein